MQTKYIGYVYKVIHIPTGKYYIGCHSGINPELDRYLGSGRYWNKFRKGKSRKEFKKEVLCYAKSLEELAELEKEYIGDLWFLDENCCNKAPGGNRSLLKNLSDEYKESKSKKLKGKQSWSKGKTFTEEHKNLIRIGLIENTNGRFGRGRKLSDNQKKMMSERQKEKFKNKEYKKWWSENVAPHKRENHPNYGKIAYNHGTHWYNNGTISIMRDKCPEGFVQGRIKWKKK